MFYLYILYNKTINKYYVGQTKNIILRLADHNQKGHKVKYSKRQQGTWEIVYIEEFETRFNAMKREKEIKNWKSSVRIRELINKTN